MSLNGVCVCQLVSIAVDTVTLQSLEGTHTLVQSDTAASDYTPVFNGQICNQVVLQVSEHKTAIFMPVV